MSKNLRIFYLGGMAVRAHTPARAARVFIGKGFARCVVRDLMREMKNGTQLVRGIAFFLENNRDVF